jgi:hypothetical protein
VKLVREPFAGSVQHRGLSLDRPLSGKCPLIQAEPRWKPIGLQGVHRRAARRCQVLCFLTAEVSLG